MLPHARACAGGCTRAARARPGASPRRSARAARRCRGSAASGRRRASSSASSSERCCVGLSSSSTRSTSADASREGLLELRELALADERARVRTRAMLDDLADGRDARRARELAQLRRARRSRRALRDRRRRGTRAPAPPRVRDRAGAQSPRDYAAVRSCGDRARRPPRRADARARRHPVRRAAARRRSASTCSRSFRRGCDAEYAGDEAFLFVSPRRPDMPLVVLAAHYDTVPAQGNLPGRIDDGAVHGLGASDMKGGLAVALELARDLDLERRRPATRARSSSGARSFRPSTTRFRRCSTARRASTRRRSRSSSSRPISTIQAGCLGNVVARLTFHGTSGHSARPWLADSALERAVRGLAPVLRARASRRGRRRARVPRGGLGDAAPGRDRRQRHPRRGDGDAQPALSARSRRRPRPRRTSRALVPDGATLEIVEQRRRRRASSRTRRSCARSSAAGDLAIEPEAGVDERRRLHGARTRRRQLRPRTHGARAPSGRARRDRRARHCVRGARPVPHAARSREDAA